MKSSSSREGQSASERIDKRIAELGDWRGGTLSRMRKLVKQADPDVVEEVKWVKPTNPGTPTWSHDGIICTGETYKSVVKLTFAKGASLKDPAKLFNSSLAGKPGAQSTSTRARRSTRAPSRRSSVPPSPSMHPAERQGQGERSRSTELPICAWRPRTERAHRMSADDPARRARSARLAPNDLRASSCELAQLEPRFPAVLVTFPT
jgi:hypothetical protein